jgi:dUTP pyrophosphatase
MIDIKVKKFSENAKIPSYAHPDSDAGMDIFSAENILVKAGERAIIKSGIGIQAVFIDKLIPLFKLEFKIAFILKGTSGNGAKKGVDVLAGVVDQGYTGEIGVVFYNSSNQDIQVNIGDKIAQGVFTLVPKVSNMEIVEEFDETQRGEKGFGETTGVVGDVNGV